MSTTKTFALTLALALSPSSVVVAQAPTPVNLFVADLTYRNGAIQVINPRKLTGDRGVNSQPSFTPDGRAILFVSRRDTTGQSDVYRIDLATGVESQVTKTPENENSPTPTANGGVMVIRWTPATLFKQWGPWIYDNTGTPSRGVLPGPDTVGYYVRVDSAIYAMMRPKSRPAVALFDARKGTMTDFDWQVANLPPQLVPAHHALSYTRTDSLGHNQICEVDLGTMQTSTLAPTLVGRTVHAWTPNGFVLMAKGSSIYITRPGKTVGWNKIANLDQPDMQSLVTYAVSPAGDKVILISPVKAPLHQALRDSLQAGRAVQDVLHSYRKAGSKGLSRFDISETGMLALASERAQGGNASDGLQLMTFTGELFPKSYVVPMERAAALRKSGDVIGALDAYRSSLALNPRATADDRTAAAAGEKAIAELSHH